MLEGIEAFASKAKARPNIYNPSNSCRGHCCCPLSLRITVLQHCLATASLDRTL